MQGQPGLASASRPGALSRRLLRLADRLHERPSMSLGELLDTLGPAGFALAIVVLAVPSFVPVPFLPTGVVCGALLVLLAPQMMNGRTRRVWVPDQLRRRAVPGGALGAALRRAVPALARVEGWLRPGRLRALAGARARPLMAALVLLMGLTLIVPVPLCNTPPAAALIILAAGLSARDGGAVLAGLVAAVAAMAWVAALSWGVILAADWGLHALW